MSTSNIFFTTTIDPDNLAVDSLNFDTTAIVSNGASSHNVPVANMIATHSSVNFNPFLFWSNNEDDLTITTDDLKFMIAFPSTSTIDSAFGNFSDATLSSFAASKNGGVTTITLPAGQQDLNYAYSSNLAYTFFNTPKGLDILDIPATFITDNATKSKTSFQNLLSSLAGIVVDINGEIIKLPSSYGGDLAVGGTIQNHPSVVFFSRLINAYGSQFSTLTTSSVTTLGANFEFYNDSEYPEGHWFDMPFISDPSFSYPFLFTLSGANQTDITGTSPSTADKTLTSKVNFAII